MNKYIGIAILIMISLSSITVANAVDDYKAHIDSSGIVVTNFKFANTDTGEVISKDVAAGDDHIVNIPNNWVLRTIVINVHFIHTSFSCNDYVVTIPFYNGKGIDLVGSTKYNWKKIYWHTYLNYEYNGQSGQLDMDTRSVYLL